MLKSRWLPVETQLYLVFFEVSSFCSFEKYVYQLCDNISQVSEGFSIKTLGNFFCVFFSQFLKGLNWGFYCDIFEQHTYK